jgi:hypothetical protein
MRAFLLACLATVLLGVGAAYLLNSGYVPDSASTVFTTPSVRI